MYKSKLWRVHGEDANKAGEDSTPTEEEITRKEETQPTITSTCSVKAGPGAVKSAIVSVVKLVSCINVPMHTKGKTHHRTLHRITLCAVFTIAYI